MSHSIGQTWYSSANISLYHVYRHRASVADPVTLLKQIRIQPLKHWILILSLQPVNFVYWR